MQEGSLVETVADFEAMRREWSLPYPKKGDLLVVDYIDKHPNKELHDKGIVLLHFVELSDLPGICDKKFTGEPNFIELQPPVNLVVEKLIENTELV